jgi:glycerophosphoryl diester phosphodiesterase
MFTKNIIPLVLCLACVLISSKCKNYKKMDIQGHRGCRGLMPENTIAAFEKALELHVNTLELDVIISGDAQVVVSHEPWLNHEITTLANGDSLVKGSDKNYNLFTMPYSQITSYDVGLRTHPRFLKQQKVAAVKPLLSQVFEAVKNKCAYLKIPIPKYNIEIKSTLEDSAYQPDNEKFVDLVMQTIINAKLEQQVCIQSFDYRNLEIMHKKYPNIILAMLIEDSEPADLEQQLKKISFIPQIISPHYSLATKEFISKAHAKNCKVIPWTVNDLPIAQTLTKLGVDGIITDYPDIINNIRLFAK